MYSIDSSFENIHSQLEKLRRNADKLEKCLNNNPQSITKLGSSILSRIETANTSLKEIRKSATLPPPQANLYNLSNWETTFESPAEVFRKPETEPQLSMYENGRKRKRQESERPAKMSITSLLNSGDEWQDHEAHSFLINEQQTAIHQQAKKIRVLSLSEGNDFEAGEEISAKGKEKEPQVSEEEEAVITPPTSWELISLTEIRGKADKIVFLEQNKYAILIEVFARKSVIEERFIDNSRIGKTFSGQYKITDMSFNPTSMQLFYQDHGAVHIYPRNPGFISDQEALPKEIDHKTNEALLSDVKQLKATNQSLALGLHNGMVLLYDNSSFELKGYYPSAHLSAVTSLCLNDKYLASGSSDKKVVYVDYKNHSTKVKRKISFDKTVHAMALEGSTLYAGDSSGLLKVVNLEKQTQKSTRLDGDIVGLLVTESGFYVASTTSDKKGSLRYLSHHLKEIYSFPLFNDPIASIVKQGDCLLVCTVKGKMDARNTIGATSYLHQFKINH